MQSNMKSLLDVSNRIWYLERSGWKSTSVTLSAFSLIIICTLSFFACITCSSSLPLKDTNLIVIVNWTFQDILRCLISVNFIEIFFNWQCYFYHHSFHIQYNRYFENYVLLLVYNNLLLYDKKVPNISNNSTFT